VSAHHEIPAPVEPSGVLPPDLPPGVEGDDVWPLAEAISDNGRWHLWAVAQGDPQTLAGPLIERVIIYAADVVAGDAATRVGVAGTWPGLYPSNLYFRDGVGHPEHVAFAGIDPEGAGFALAVDYHEVVYFYAYPSHPEPTEARLLVYGC
jgi:hypothetical protein